MKKNIYLPVLIVIILAGCIFGIYHYSLKDSGESASYGVWYQEYTSADEISKIAINTINHNIIIKLSSDENIRVSYYRKTSNEINYITCSNGVISIDMIEEAATIKSGFFYQSASSYDTITVEIPQDMILPVECETVSGDMTIDNPQLSSLIYTSVSGKITITSCQIPTISIETNSGKVNLDQADFQKLDIQTVTGNIDVDLSQPLEKYNLTMTNTYGDTSIRGNNLAIENKKTVEYDQQLGNQFNITIQTYRGTITID